MYMISYFISTNKQLPVVSPSYCITKKCEKEYVYDSPKKIS